MQFEVRCYAAEMSHRLTMTHELNTCIIQRFKEHNINIALPQLDLHVKEAVQVTDTSQGLSMKKGSLK